MKITVGFPVKIPDMILTGTKDWGRPEHLLQKSFQVVINHELLIIPAGYISDLGSIPAPARVFYAPNDPQLVPCYLLHDIAYGAELWPRRYCDKLFLAAMRYQMVRWSKRMIIYGAVRMFGGLTYPRHTVESISNIRNLMGLTSGKRPLWEPGEVMVDK